MLRITVVNPHFARLAFFWGFGASLPGCGGSQGTLTAHANTASGGTAGTFANSSEAGIAGGDASSGGIGGPSEAGAARILMDADFQARSPGVYTQAMVAGDFSGTPGWNNGLDQGRATIVDEAGNRFLRVTYPAGIYGPTDGGVQFIVPLAGSFDELYLSYRVRFAAGFDFVLGGKLPGLVGGTHPTGCVSDDGGFSARMMWRPAGAAVQYLYFPEKVNACGDDYAYQVGGTAVLFGTGQWHRVQHRIRMNTPGAHDGILQAWFDGSLALDNETFIYRVATASFGIDSLYFSTFFGGSDATWAPAAAQVADFDDFIVSDQPIP